MPKQNPIRKTNYLFTLNNYTDEELSHLNNWDGILSTEIKYIIFGKEVGAQGTPHLQGYVEFRGRKTLASAKAFLGTNRIHLDLRDEKQMSQQNCIEYCKKDGDWVEFGQCARQGNRSDLQGAIESLRNVGLESTAEQYPGVFVRYGRGLRDLQFTVINRAVQRQLRPVHVTVYYGPPGTGKTHRAFVENATDCFILRRGNSGVWFDGYDQQKVLIIDDFKGWIPFQQLLNLLDKYPMCCEIKGGMVWAHWTKVIITSNHHPDEWYDYERNMLCKAALMRRLNEIVLMELRYV